MPLSALCPLSKKKIKEKRKEREEVGLLRI